MNKTKNYLKLIFLLITVTPMPALIVRHDVAEQRMFELAKQYPEIVHFNNGEGTLVAPQWVLTAAHVGELYQNEQDEKKLTVTCNGKSYRIQKVYNHPRYSAVEGQGIENDVALVKLATPVTNVKPAKLFRQKDEVGKIIVLVGAGQTGTGLTGPQKDHWDHKTRAATNKVDGIENGFIYFKFDSPDTQGVSELEGISGPGDSGGPAFVKMKNEAFVLGISSHQKAYVEVDDHGNTTGGEGKYAAVEFYSRVSDYVGWIESIIKSGN